MKIVKMFLGVVAVLFSVQPLLTWAANANETKKDIKIAKPSRDGKTKTQGSPICGGCEVDKDK